MRWWRPREPVDPMYMPGRRRTGSRPSRTVMSFAVYAASAIKKALQFPGLRASSSVSDRTAGAVTCKARRGRSLHLFAQLFVTDRSSQVRRLGELLRRRVRGGSRSGFRHLSGWFGDLTRSKPKPAGRVAAESL